MSYCQVEACNHYKIQKYPDTK